MKTLFSSSYVLATVILGASFFIGIWHGFPQTTTVFDEMFAPGVLRAMEQHSLLPQGIDIPYGTLTYFLNYIFIAAFLMILFPFFSFKIEGIKLFLLDHPWMVYGISRFISALLAVGMLFVFDRILRRTVEDARTRLFLNILAFTNIVTAVVFRTSKVWVLSFFLILLSLHYLLETHQKKETAVKSAGLSVLFSFLAFANFPLAGFALINIPFLFFFFRSDKNVMKRLALFVCAGGIVFTLITAANWQGVHWQVGATANDYVALSATAQEHSLFAPAVFMNAKKTVMLFPLLLLTLLFVLREKIQDRILFRYSLAYFATYFIAISIVAKWANDPHAYLRYLLPLGFFLALIVASFAPRWRKSFAIAETFALLVYALTIFYLSVSTTYNNAEGWIIGKFSTNTQKIAIVNRIGADLELPKNKQAYLLTKEKYCGTKCKNMLENPRGSFSPVVLDEKSKDGVDLSAFSKIYYLEPEKTKRANMTLVKSFLSGEGGGGMFHIADNIGDYFDTKYYWLHRLGKDTYVYTEIIPSGTNNRDPL